MVILTDMINPQHVLLFYIHEYRKSSPIDPDPRLLVDGSSLRCFVQYVLQAFY